MDEPSADHPQLAGVNVDVAGFGPGGAGRQPRASVGAIDGGDDGVGGGVDHRYRADAFHPTDVDVAGVGAGGADRGTRAEDPSTGGGVATTATTATATAATAAAGAGAATAASGAGGAVERADNGRTITTTGAVSGGTAGASGGGAAFVGDGVGLTCAAIGRRPAATAAVSDGDRAAARAEGGVAAGPTGAAGAAGSGGPTIAAPPPAPAKPPLESPPLTTFTPSRAPRLVAPVTTARSIWRSACIAVRKRQVLGSPSPSWCRANASAASSSSVVESMRTPTGAGASENTAQI
jgi:hypothetical protein